MAITNQFFTINDAGFPSTKTVEDYKSSQYDQWFLEGYRLQLKSWHDNYEITENNSSRETWDEHPSKADLLSEISKLETALTEKYGLTF